MQIRRRIVWVAAFLVAAALLIVLCVTLYVRNQPSEFDGTLVNHQIAQPAYTRDYYGEGEI